MKSRCFFVLAGLLVGGIGLKAAEPFFLIKIQPRPLDSASFQVKRDLFAFDRSTIDRPLAVVGAADPSFPAATLSASPAEPAAGEPPAPRFEVVFLGSIVRRERPCALLAVNGEMQVVEEGETLENGWRVTKIGLTSLTVWTEQGDMLFAVEGDDHV